MPDDTPPLDYLTPSPDRRWSWRKRILVTVAAVVAIVVLIYLGMCVAFVASNINNR